MMRNILVTFIVFLSLNFLSGQKNEDLFFLETDTSWRKELFTFPIRFADNIKYAGVEDARFPVGWEDQKSDHFWSYVFAWNVETSENISAKKLEEDLQKYFNGLMGWKKTTVNISLKKKEGSNTQFIGAVNTIDNFFTKAPMTLNVKIDKTYCHEKNQSLILFRFSPQKLHHKVW